MEVNAFLALLKKVKRSGPGKWMACCPAHDDNKPSMAVTSSKSGVILVHCFSNGCDVGEICGAVGIEPTELFPPKLERYEEQDKPAKFGSVTFTAHDALMCLASEGLVVAIVASDIDEGRIPSVADRDRISIAVGRILAALEYVT